VRTLALLGAGLIFVFGGAALVLWAGQHVYDFHVRMPGNAVRTDARVDDFRTATRSVNGKSSRESKELRYAFSVKGSDKEYVKNDDFLFVQQRHVWVEVPERTYERAQETGTIRIEYLKSDPSINQAVAARFGWGSVIGFSLLGLFSLAIGGALVLGGARSPRTADPAAPHEA
jgi:hypothetical protein